MSNNPTEARQQAPAIDPALYRETLGYFPTGVVVITAIAEDGQPVGMVVGSFTSVSLDPALVAYLPTKNSGSYARLRTASHFAVNVLAADQTDLCGRFASRAADKFDGVEWAPGPNGSPVLAGAVSWIECEVDSEVDGGDHWIVLGRVLNLAVQRPSLPLLFFQGGYGRFALPSPVTASDPELIEGVRLAEPLREPLRAFAATLGADCSIMARVGDEAVFVMAESTGAAVAAEAGSLAVGHRIPLIPPVGTVFHAQSTADEVDRWLGRAKATDEDIERFRAQVAAVRDKGHSVSLLPSEEVDRVALMSDYSGIDVLPVHERALRKMITESATLYEPELSEDGRHDLHSVIVPVPNADGCTRLAVRISRLPAGVSAPQVREWVAALHEIVGA